MSSSIAHRIADEYAGPGVADLHRSDADKGMASTYALLVADTVLVPLEGTTNEVLTSACPKSWTDVAYFFKVCHTTPLGAHNHACLGIACTADMWHHQGRGDW